MILIKNGNGECLNISTAQKLGPLDLPNRETRILVTYENGDRYIIHDITMAELRNQCERSTNTMMTLPLDWEFYRASEWFPASDD